MQKRLKTFLFVFFFGGGVSCRKFLPNCADATKRLMKYARVHRSTKGNKQKIKK